MLFGAYFRTNSESCHESLIDFVGNISEFTQFEIKAVI